jgi:hypothetical protein
MINLHFDKVEKLRKKQIEEIPAVQKGDFYLQITFEKSQQAKLVQMAIERAK